jgi:hypothetical protein
MEKIEHAVVGTLLATKDLITETIDVVKGTIVETIVAPFTESSSVGRGPDLRTEEEKFKANLKTSKLAYCSNYHR